jgi:hypothetical protein
VRRKGGRRVVERVRGRGRGEGAVFGDAGMDERMNE